MDPAPVQPQASKSDQLKDNLKAWSSLVRVFFLGCIPVLLVLVFALPQEIKEEFLIFHTSYPLNLHTLVLSEYTHSQLFPHMIGNIVFYYITILAIFAFENNRKRFWVMAGVSLLLVPVICSSLTLVLWHFFGSATSGQGFSGINAAFLAYALMIFVTWFLSGKLELFDHKEAFAGAVWRYYVSYIFMTVMVALIVLVGILEGQFMPAGNTIINGIAHFGGFITGLIVFLLYDILTEKRKNFDLMVIISIIIGIFYYTDYLVRIVRAVKGL
jgi:hypothetical protein